MLQDVSQLLKGNEYVRSNDDSADQDDRSDGKSDDTARRDACCFRFVRRRLFERSGSLEEAEKVRTASF